MNINNPSDIFWNVLKDVNVNGSMASEKGIFLSPSEASSSPYSSGSMDSEFQDNFENQMYGQQQSLEDVVASGQIIYGYPIYENPADIAYNPITIPSTNLPNSLPQTSTYTENLDYCDIVNSTQQEPFLEIKEQPTAIFRYRYETEMQGPHGTILSKHAKKTLKTFPTVSIKNFDSTARVMIRCSLYQIEEDKSTGSRNLHPHRLVSRSGDFKKFDPHMHEVSKENQFTAVFQGLGIIQAKKGSEMREVLMQKIKAEREFEENRKLSEDEITAISLQTVELTKKVNINQVCLGFTAFCRNETTGQWKKLCKTVYSNVINNQKNAKHGDLKICRISTVVSEAKGGQEIFMFVSKVDKHLIGVKFFELDEDGNVKWEADGNFGPADVHHQYGICLKTPPYENQNIEEEVKCSVVLYRKGEEETSDPQPFTYKPNSSAGLKRKRSDSHSLIPLSVFERDEQTSHDYNMYIGSNPQPNTSQALFDNSSNASNQQHDEISIELSYICNIIANSPKEFDNIVDEYFCNENDAEHGKLQTDSTSHNANIASPDTKEIDLPIFTKIKLMLKLFKKDYLNDKLRDMLRALIDAGNERDEKVLLDVIQHGTINDIRELVLILLKYKILDVFNSTNSIDQNALHLIILAGHTDLLKLFITLGADVNQKDAFGLTPLHVAVKKNLLEIVKELVDSCDSICIDEIDDNGRTALSFAVYNDNIEIAKFLVDAGADLTKINPSNGFTCLHDAISVNAVNFELIKYLVETNQELLLIENYKGKKAIDIALTNKTSDEIINYLSSFSEEANFDDECLTELCAIFDENDNWRMWLTLMDMEEKIEEWCSFASPSKALFEYFKNAKKTLDNILELLELVSDDERDRAINAIDEMMVRKLNKLEI